MDTPILDTFAAGLARRGFGGARFEFPYMQGRQTRTGKKTS
jgi:predicted alpha/beta-hydrolase family hydrolase